MKYFSPTFWLQAGVAFLALQQAAQGAPVKSHPMQKLLSKEDFKNLTPYRQKEYLQNAERLIYNVDKTPLTRSEVRKIYDNYNQVSPEYTGAKLASNKVKINVMGADHRFTNYKIDDAQPDSERHRNCPKRKKNEVFGFEAEAIKCLKKGETGLVGRTTACKREADNKVYCSTRLNSYRKPIPESQGYKPSLSR